MSLSSNPLQLFQSAGRSTWRWARRSWKTAGLALVFAIVLVYSTVAFIPLPEPISPDNNTAYRLSRLAADGAVFGRDAVSFYGSLGYWLRGAIVGENFDTVFVVRLALHLLLVVVAWLKLSRLTDNLTRLSLVLSLLFPYLIAEAYPALQTESQLVFIWLLLLSLGEIWQNGGRCWAIGLGATAGVLLNGNTAIGVALILSLMLFLLVRGVLRWQDAPEFDTGVAIALELVETPLAFGAIAFLSLAPGAGDPLWRLLLVGGITATIGYSLVPLLLRRATVIDRLVPKLGEILRRLDRADDRARPPLAELGACGAFGLGLVYLIGFTEPSLATYLRSYLELNWSYSSAMSLTPSEAIVGFAGYLQGYIAALTGQLDTLPLGMEYGGSPLELRLVTLEILGLLAGLALTTAFGNPALAIAIFPVFFTLIDRGLVVRGHQVLIFIFSVPFLLAIVISSWRSRPLRWYGLAAHLLTLLLCLWSYAYYIQVEDYPVDPLSALAPDRVRLKATALFQPQQLQDALEQQSAANLIPLQFPEAIRQTIGDRSVDILPDASTIAAANDLNWQPLPVIPTHLAYTEYLDQLNREALDRNPRDLLLYRFEPSGDHHPFFDAPATSYHLWCNYELAPDLPAPLLPEADAPLADLLALTPRDRDRCAPPIAEQTLSVSWNQQQPISTAQNAIVRAEIRVRYSPWGQLMKLLFRIPPVHLTLWNSADEAFTYRILPKNATGSVLFSPLPRTQLDIQGWFRGEFPDRMYGFSFSTRDPSLFAPTIQVTLQTHTPEDIIDIDLPGFP